LIETRTWSRHDWNQTISDGDYLYLADCDNATVWAFKP